MFEFDVKKYDRYKLEYNQFICSKARSIHSSMSVASEYNSDIASLLKYPAKEGVQRIFLVVPSIFNSPEILFFNFIQNLQKQGDVYVVNWLENERQLLIEDYVYELKKIIQILGEPIDLVGHCIGGNISIALANMPNIHSLTLLTCPWDYSHFYKWVCIYDSLGLDKALENSDFVPKIYIQMMFFLMFPSQFQEKIHKYFNLVSEEEKELFMQVEAWLQSGNKISKSMYRQIIQDFCQRNVLHENNWSIDGDLVQLQNIEAPVCLVSAKGDQIVPCSSMQPLQKQIKNTTLIEVEGGHIGYLISDRSDFQNKYNQWLVN